MNEETPGTGGGDPLHLIPDFHRSTRMPLDAVVRLHFEGTVAYQNGFAANVSALGMFVKHPEPPAVGTRLVFEFVLGEERKPVQGGGVVAWVRERYDGPGRAAGVGITFTELDALSRQHIAEALFEYLEAQLGVDVADHPDVPDLLAAVPRHSEVELGLEPPGTGPNEALPSAAPEPPPEPVAERRATPEAAPLTFQLFEEPATLLEPDLAPERLFAAEVPPDDATGAGRVARSGAVAPEHRRSPLALAGIAALALAAVLGGWWYLLGPGSVRDGLESDAGETATVAPKPRPTPLDPEPGPVGTLAEAVGAEPEPGEAASDPRQPAIDDAAPTLEPGTPAPESAAAVAESAVAPAPPPPTTTAVPLEAAPVPEAPAVAGLRLSEIVWDSAPGSTVVQLVGSEPIRAGGYRFYDMPGERPRLLVKLTGVAAGYPRPTVAVGTEEISAIRVGYHEKPAGNELHVVFDLAAPAVRVAAVELEEGRIVVRLTRPE